jgi:hypothetical protein
MFISIIYNSYRIPSNNSRLNPFNRFVNSGKNSSFSLSLSVKRNGGEIIVLCG